MSSPFLGEIKMVGYNFAPRGYAFCNGQLMPIAQNAAVFALLGTTYGGDGTTTFRLPNMQGRVPMHQGNGPGLTSRVLGESGGTENVTLTSTNLPAHAHAVSIPASTTVGNASAPAPANKLAVSSLRGDNQFTSGTTDTTLAPFNSNNTGSGTAISVMQPFLVVNFIIALQGVFPSRN